MAPSNNVTRMLGAKKVAFEAHELPDEKLGALEAAAFLGVNPAQMFKSIVLTRSDGGKPVLALVSGEAEVSAKALGRLLNTKKLTTASLKQAEALTGLQAGGISPLALTGKGFEVVLDDSALEFEKIYVSGGQRGLNISLSPRELAALTGAKIAQISA